MNRPTELIEKAKGFKSTDPIRVLAEYAVSLESPRKTVADAVDYFDGDMDDAAQVIVFDETTGIFHQWLSGWNSARITDCYQVCTREEFEAEVERRKGEEWTHDYLYHENGTAKWMPCNLLVDAVDNDGCYAVVNSFGFYVVAESIRKRKPAISKAEADAVKAFYDWAANRPCAVLRVEDYLEQFDFE